MDPYIPTYILKQQSDYFITALTKIIILSLLNGEFDSSWKFAILRPLIKKADGLVEKPNYTPVSNVLFISKLVEKAVQDQFVKHRCRAKLNSELQSAYMEGHSCETALLKIQND